ncbi:hypothetical protein OAP63_03075 [Vibrio sp.]|uniref:Uncharacterized protein n=1 Tax=Vibrio viridaestus TaxID=2487322 RepID=A0A3N9TGJ7_9VIBR|nr:hypothetical protein [Vibrio viridaestus]MDC0609691.1 hypothetical protein [Vibrio sp.]RQW63398.1 hypothetical protein EES38_09115 [Vibrio viridaestus]
MFSKHGVCDWCKKRALVTKLNYVDGKSNFACASCSDIAKMDVRLYNLEQASFTALQQTQQTHHHSA